MRALFVLSVIVFVFVIRGESRKEEPRDRKLERPAWQSKPFTNYPKPKGLDDLPSGGDWYNGFVGGS